MERKNVVIRWNEQRLAFCQQWKGGQKSSGPYAMLVGMTWLDGLQAVSFGLCG